jgi:hypothetical protein
MSEDWVAQEEDGASTTPYHGTLGSHLNSRQDTLNRVNTKIKMITLCPFSKLNLQGTVQSSLGVHPSMCLGPAGLGKVNDRKSVTSCS